MNHKYTPLIFLYASLFLKASLQASTPPILPESFSTLIPYITSSSPTVFLPASKGHKKGQKNAQAPSKEDKQDLFKKAFGPSLQLNTHQLLAPFFLNGLAKGKVLVKISGKEHSFQAYQPLKFMQALMSPKAFKALQQEVDEQGFLSITRLKQLSYIVAFDPQQLTLSLEIPAVFRRQQSLSIRKSLYIDEKAIIPEVFSTYLNTYVQKEYDKSPLKSQWAPFRSRFESCFNLFNWVYENNFSYSPTETGVKWKHSTQRLSYDLPEKMMRFLIGDFNRATTNFRTLSGFGGIGLNREFDTQPGYEKAAIIEKDFFLETPSTLEIYVNGNRSRRFDLEPGLHTLSEFTKESGYNEGKVRITDRFGKVQWVDFSFYYDPKLLKPQTHSFSYNLLYPRTTKNGHILYDTHLPTLDLEHFYGLSEHHTTGAYLQKNALQDILGFQNLFNFLHGRLNLDIALSRHKNSPSSYASYLKYILYPNNTEKNKVSASFSMMHKGKYFTSLGARNSSNPIATLFTSTFNKNLEKDLQGHASISFEWARDKPHTGYFVNLGLDKSWSPVFESLLQFQFKKDIQKKRDIGLALTLNINLAANESQLSYHYNSLTHDKSFYYNTNHSKIPRTESIDLSYQSSPQDQNAFVLYNRGHDLFNAGLSFDHFQTRDQNYESSKVHLNGSSSLVFAGGNFGISKPVSNSFALFVPHPTIQAWEVMVNPSKTEYLTKTHSYSPAVVGNLTPYMPTRFFISSPKLPQGYSLGDNNFVLLATQKSGFCIQVGEGASIMLQSQLVDSLGEPLVLQAGKIHFLDKEKEPLSFFTNKTGRLRIQGLYPGRFRLEVFSPKYKSIEIEFERDQEGLVNLPQLLIPLSD